jgi:DNA polymerase-3 subunit epsilon
LNGAGFFHQAHRAVDDCHALLEVLVLDLPTTGSPALALLLKTARKKTWRVWAEQSPFELKDSLKRRGYRWSDGSDGLPRSWCIDVHEAALNDEIAFLKAEIYLRDFEPRLQTLTAFHPLLGEDLACTIRLEVPNRMFRVLRAIDEQDKLHASAA